MKLTTLSIAATAALAFAAVPATSVYAWHPEGKITKFVANETTNSASVDANTEAQSVKAKKGDILKYTITVKNIGKPASNGTNDLAFVEITDTLPAGVELISGELKQKIDGVIKPGQPVTKEIRVRVTSGKETDLLKNRACFKGDSTVKDNPQQGCDDTYTQVKNEKPAEQPETPITPEQPTGSGQGGNVLPAAITETPAELPSTGLGAIISTIAGTGVLSYAASLYVRSKKGLRKNLLKH